MTELRLVPLSPVALADGEWHSDRQGRVRFLVCKATYDLVAGACTLSHEPLPIQERDAYWEDDARRSLRAASELVPPRPHAEVTLVGSAYAPAQTPVHRLVVRLAAGPIEKAVEVRSDRTVDINEQLSEGAPFSRMPLTWERAAGGPGTANPVGRRHDRNSMGKLLLPNLQAPAVDPAPPDWSLGPVGFGPVSPHWPARSIGLRGPAPTLSGHSYGRLGDGFDFSFFQAAPRDQQFSHLATDTQLVLENLHPVIASLVTRLPGHRARAVLEPTGAEIPLVCDAIAIDTDAQKVTLVWRGSFRAQDHAGASRALVVLEPRDNPFSVEGIRDLAMSPDSTAPQVHAKANLQVPAILPFDAPGASGSQRPRANTAGTPFGGERLPEVVPSNNMERTASMAVPAFLSGAARQGPPPAPPPPMAAPPVAAPALAPVVAAAAPAIVGGTLAALGSASAQLSPAPAASRSPSAPPVFAGASAFTQTPVSPTKDDFARPPQPFSPSALAAAQKPPSYLVDRSPKPEKVSVGHAADVAEKGVLAASHAAASAEPKAAPRAEETAAPAAARGPALELLYHHPSAVEKVKRYRKKGKVRDEWLGSGSTLAESSAERDQHLVASALSRADSLDLQGIRDAMVEAIDADGVSNGPLVACSGEIALMVDPFEQLAVTIALAEPFAAADRRVKEAIEAAQGLSQAHRATPHGMIEGATVRLRQTFSAAVRSVAPDYLETSASRYLAEERKFVRRTVFGEACLVGAIATGDRRMGRETGSAAPVTFYLPVAAEAFLPLVPSFAGKLYGVGRAAVDGGRAPQLFVLAIGVTR